MKDLADRIESAIRPSSMCRDCADNFGRCPNNGELCDPKESAKELSDMVRLLIAPSKIEELITKYTKRENNKDRPPFEQEAYGFAAYDLQQLVDKVKQ